MWGKNLLRDQLVRVLEPRFRSLNTVRTSTKLAFNFHSQLLAVPDPLSLLVLYLVSRQRLFLASPVKFSGKESYIL